RTGAAGAPRWAASLSVMVDEADPPAHRRSRLPGPAAAAQGRTGRRVQRRRMKMPPVNVPRLVVRSDLPGRRRLVLGILFLVVAVLLWAAFQWGRGNLGLPGGVTPDRVTLR